MTSRQTTNPKSTLGHGWTEFEVLSINQYNELDSKTTIRTPEVTPFLDISIEEYTGKTRRLRYTSVRLEEEAARKLYEALAAKFASAA